jgi:uncharacterized protein (DUF1697 family)
MPRFVVLLRGVNVGKGNRVPMADFKSVLEALGYADVTTLLNSGNAVFNSSQRSATRHSKCIAAALFESMGVQVATVVKSSAEFATAVAANPITVPEADHSKLLVTFAQDRATLLALEPIQALVQPPERLAVGKEAAYLYCASGILASKAGAALLGRTGQSVTTRNWATTLKLASLLGGSAA